jgi:predicted transcriptional regulator
MEKRKAEGRSMKPDGTASVRASISFPPEIYGVLEQLARQKKVSLAWVVRDAVERYVAEQKEQLEQE